MFATALSSQQFQGTQLHNSQTPAVLIQNMGVNRKEFFFEAKVVELKLHQHSL